MALTLTAWQAGTDASTSSPDLALHYPSAQVSQTVAREMLDALDEEYARIRHELGCVIGAKITVVVIPLATWDALGNPAWSGGFFDGRIQVPLVYERSRVGPKMRRVFAHEIVHACIETGAGRESTSTARAAEWQLGWVEPCTSGLGLRLFIVGGGNVDGD